MLAEYFKQAAPGFNIPDRLCQGEPISSILTDRQETPASSVPSAILSRQGPSSTRQTLSIMPSPTPSKSATSRPPHPGRFYQSPVTQASYDYSIHTLDELRAQVQLAYELLILDLKDAALSQQEEDVEEDLSMWTSSRRTI